MNADERLVERLEKFELWLLQFVNHSYPVPVEYAALFRLLKDRLRALPQHGGGEVVQWATLAEGMLHELRQDYAPGELKDTDGVAAIRKLRALLTRPQHAGGKHCIWDGCDLDAKYCDGHAKEAFAPPAAERGAVRVPRLYLDCDGVLADFDAAFERAFAHPPRVYEDKHGSKVFWEDIRGKQPTFYRDLPLMPDAKALFNAVAEYRPIILTGCPLGGWAEMQKLAWAVEHFPGTPMITCMSKDKRVYCAPGDILVDDRPQYRSRWEEAGGVFVHYTGDTQATIREVRALLTRPEGKL